MKNLKCIVLLLICFSAADSFSQYKGGSYDGYFSQIETNVMVTTEDINEIVRDFQLHQNYPNPFNPSTVIRYNLYVSSFVKVEVFDISGKLTAELVNGNRDAGEHEIVFDAGNFPAGVYFCKLTSGSGTNVLSVTRKMILIK